VNVHAEICHSDAVRPRLGILAFHPIQYQAPLDKRLAARGKVTPEILFLSDAGLAPTRDAGFGMPVAWDVDLLSGYPSSFLATRSESTGLIADMAVGTCVGRHNDELWPLPNP